MGAPPSPSEENPIAMGTAARRVSAQALFASTLIALASAPVESAEIYKCFVGGQTVYQDQRCPGGQLVDVTPSPANGGKSKGDDDLSALRARVAEMERERKKREMSAESEKLESSIGGYERAQEAEMQQLRDKRGYVDNNYAGANWERNSIYRGINAEMQAVTAKYKEQIDAA